MAGPDLVNSGCEISPIPDGALSLISRSAAQTQGWGRILAALLERGDMLCLVGELGTGKTCFVQGVGHGLGVAEPIVSPTFIRVREYAGGSDGLPLYHIDLYRLSGKGEGLRWGLEEYLYGEGVCAIEWAERLRGLPGAVAPDGMSPSCLWICFRHGPERDVRRLDWWAQGQRGERLLVRFREGVWG